jgi:indolepyruvate ferredoxin oxidoreductase alpha subunit
MVSHARSNVNIGNLKNSGLKDDFDLSKEVNIALRFYFLKMKKDHIYNRMRKALEMSESSNLNRIENEDALNEFKLGIITSGVSYSYIVEALNFLELEAPILKIGFINPLPEKKIVSFLEKCSKVFVVEENDPYLETQILAIAHRNSLKVIIHGKDPFSYSKDKSLLPFVGELNPTLVALAIKQITRLETKIDLDEIYNKKYDILKRKPIMCAGCPHRTTGYALQKAVKKIQSKSRKKVYFYQDIGCYTLLALPPFSFANVKYCMGSSIALAQGVAQTSESLNIAIIGDGTFFHSGIPALLNGIYNKAPIIVLILDNGWIGMTGQQAHPGSDTRYYEGGNLRKMIDLEEFLKGTGADVTVITHSENQDDGYIAKLRNLIIEKGIDVLENRSIHVILIRDECVQKIVERQPLTKRYVNLELCNNCGICYNQYACSAIDERNNCAFIDSSLCLGCGVCEEICVNNAIYREETL